MEIVKQLGSLVEQATSDAHAQTPLQLYSKILTIVQSRADMPKHILSAVSKRLSIKNKKVLYYCFDLLEYLSYHVQLSLYTQISTKEFLLKVSTLLMNQELDPLVHTRILQTIKVWEEMFRPHDDLLPMFFQFYAQILKRQFPSQKDYVSPYRPKDWKAQQRKKIQEKRKQTSGSRQAQRKVAEPSKSQQQTFEQIRAQIILQIIDNADPAQGVKSNPLLMQMMDEIKKSQKKINQTINQNPNQKIMELALAANDDIYITYRRYKDIQKNRKPEPFILTQLASDFAKEADIKEQKKIQAEIKSKNKSKVEDQFSQFDKKPSQPPVAAKVEEKPKKPADVDIFDVACQPSVPKKKEEPVDLINMGNDPAPPAGQSSNMFDLLGSASNPPPPQNAVSPNMELMSNNFGDMSQQNPNQPNQKGNITLESNLQGSNFQTGATQPFQSNVLGNISLSNNYTTQNDIQKYDDRSIFDKLTDLTSDLRQNRKE